MCGVFLQWSTTPRRVDPALRWTHLLQDGETPLHLAARAGKSDAAALLLDRGAAIEAKDKVSGIFSCRGKRGFTPSWQVRRVRHVCNGRPLCLVDPALWRMHLMQDGNTPLHWAARTSNMDAATLLLDRGAAIEAPDKVSGISRMQGEECVHTKLAVLHVQRVCTTINHPTPC